MRELLMQEIASDRTQAITIDDFEPIDSGAFGTIYAVDGIPSVVIKRLDVDPPRPLAAIRDYTAHITVTRARLEAILKEEQSQVRPRRFIIEYISKILAYSLSTHWSCDVESLHITAVWLLQRRAAGKSLKHHFAETAPPLPAIRKRIAREFVTRMRTLRRADLVHLDCVHDNVFLDLSPLQVTAIDLDGCGIVSRRRSASRTGLRDTTDDWEYRPVTLGHTRLVRLPPWYPQPGLVMGPRKGNFLFAERWVVLDTIIRILTWGKFDALSWLDDARARMALTSAYKVLASELLRFNELNHDSEAAVSWWSEAWQDKARALAVDYRLHITPQSGDFWESRGHPGCLVYFAELAEQAFFEPHVLSSAADSAPLYDTFGRRLG